MAYNNIHDNQNYNITKILDDALLLSKPSDKELEILLNIDKNIKTEIKKEFSSSIVDVITGGSFAKGTNLKLKTDIDIFILINPQLEEKKFEKLALDIGFKVLKNHNPRTRYAEHPYVEGFVKIDNHNNNLDNFVRINLVPCYDVEKGMWKSAADRSRFHVEYMKSMLNERQKDDVRLLKMFLKTMGVYGAEISISGFSGYVCEVLILKFGDFYKVINYFANLIKMDSVISISQDSEDQESTSKFKTPVVILDPIDNNRNLGAAISSESLAKFIQSARSFIKNPSINYFKISNQSNKSNLTNEYKKHIKKITGNIIFINFKYKYTSPDIIWGQLKKTAKAITRELDQQGFEIIRHTIYSNEKDLAIIAIFVKYIELPKFYFKTGPSIFMKDESEKFIDTNANKSTSMWFDNSKISCIIERGETNIIKIIKTMLKENIKNIGIPKGLIDTMSKQFDIYTINDLKNDKIVENLTYDLLSKDPRIFYTRH
ncbi:MAG: CCA tRNA nucleotidyltransferase [Nitrososphaeraceae archaeon]